MKFSHISVIAIILVVIAVSIAGCTSSSPATPASPATGGAPSGGSAAPSGGSATPAAASGPVSAASLFGGLNYEWTEYKMSAGTGTDAMTIFYKYNHKTGKCTMRFESAQKIEGMPSEMDCSAGASSGGQSASNPNDVGPEVKFVKVGTETVTVPAGTFLADKYTATSGDMTSTYWIANGKPLLKMEGGSSSQGSVVCLLYTSPSPRD